MSNKHGIDTHSSCDEIEPAATPTTLADILVTLPGRVHLVRGRWRPARAEHLLRSLVRGDTELGRLREMWRQVRWASGRGGAPAEVVRRGRVAGAAGAHRGRADGFVGRRAGIVELFVIILKVRIGVLKNRTRLRWLITR